MFHLEILYEVYSLFPKYFIQTGCLKVFDKYKLSIAKGCVHFVKRAIKGLYLCMRDA